MIYNVFGGTLSLTPSINQSSLIIIVLDVVQPMQGCRYMRLRDVLWTCVAIQAFFACMRNASMAVTS